MLEAVKSNWAYIAATASFVAGFVSFALNVLQLHAMRRERKEQVAAIRTLAAAPRLTEPPAVRTLGQGDAPPKPLVAPASPEEVRAYARYRGEVAESERRFSLSEREPNRDVHGYALDRDVRGNRPRDIDGNPLPPMESHRAAAASSGGLGTWLDLFQLAGLILVFPVLFLFSRPRWALTVILFAASAALLVWAT